LNKSIYTITVCLPNPAPTQYYIIVMRRYGDISIQYRYGGSRYISWPSAIYRDTTLTFVIRGSHHVVSIFCIWRVFCIRSRSIISVGVVCVKCLLKWTFKWTILHLQWLKMVNSYSTENMFLTFKLRQSSQTFYCLVIFYFAISSQIPRISNLTLYTIYYIVIILLRIITFNETVLHVLYM